MTRCLPVPNLFCQTRNSSDNSFFGNQSPHIFKITRRRSGFVLCTSKILRGTLKMIVDLFFVTNPTRAVDLDRNISPNQRSDPTITIGVALTDKTRARFSSNVRQGAINFGISSHLHPNGVGTHLEVKLASVLLRMP